MISLVKLTMKNFLSYKDASISLDKRGMCLISGRNEDAFDSNGSGKSSIFAAIVWALYGRTPKGIVGDEVINRDAGDNCMVELVVNSIDSGEIIVRRYRNHEEHGSSLAITVDGKQLSGKLTEIQPVVEGYIGMDYDTFVSTSLYAQDVVNLLGQATDSERRKIFANLLNLDRFDVAYSYAENVCHDLSSELGSLNEDRNEDVRLLEDVENEIVHVEEELKKWNEAREERIKKIHEQLAALPPKVQLKPLRSEERGAEEELKALNLDQAEAEASMLLAEIRVEEAGLRDKCQKVLREACPTCDRPFTEEDMKRMASALQEDIEEAESRLADKKRKLKEHQHTIKEVGMPLRGRLFDLQSAIRQHELNNDKIKDQEALLTRHLDVEEENDSSISDAHFIRMIDKKESLILSIKDYDEKIEALQEEVNYVDAVSAIFSKKGIQSFIMESSFSTIEEKANEYLSILSEGEFVIHLAPTKQLKSGEERENIHLSIERRRKEVPYSTLSDGERQRVNTAILFSINAFVRNRGLVSFVLLDEVLDLSLDESGQELVMELLRRLAKDVELCMVVSHKSGLKESFDNVIEVVHKNGESTIVEDI